MTLDDVVVDDLNDVDATLVNNSLVTRLVAWVVCLVMNVCSVLIVEFKFVVSNDKADVSPGSYVNSIVFFRRDRLSSRTLSGGGYLILNGNTFELSALEACLIENGFVLSDNLWRKNE